ncbi:hypothetical protein E2C01_008189 [Portunus trituberculatus]|uniref:Uncharacterized protein n=1 Tax=Portunus trituberculatus TaxID=210409 RepID=A0A5B7D138_PORTR|nr:hypothetical protein [Portunus trituberculatus]
MEVLGKSAFTHLSSWDVVWRGELCAVSRPSQETKLEEEKKRAEEAQNHKRKETDDLKILRRRKEELENEVDDLKDSVTQLESTKEKNIQKHKREADNLKKENDNLTIRMNGLESELKSEKRRRERLEKDSNSFRERANARSEEELKKVKEELDTLRTTHKGQAQHIPLRRSLFFLSALTYSKDVLTGRPLM